MPNQLRKSVIQLQAKINRFNWSVKHDPVRQTGDRKLYMWKQHIETDVPKYEAMSKYSDASKRLSEQAACA